MDVCTYGPDGATRCVLGPGHRGAHIPVIPQRVALDGGDRAMFTVPGGTITVTLMPDGTLELIGAAGAAPRTHQDRLAVYPRTINSLRVHLAPRE